MRPAQGAIGKQPKLWPSTSGVTNRSSPSTVRATMRPPISGATASRAGPDSSVSTPRSFARRGSAQALDDRRVRLAAALAHGLEAQASSRRFQVVEHRGHQPHAARAEWVTDGDRPTPWVVPRRIGTELLRPHQRDGSEGLVALDRVELVDLHAGALEQLAR